MSVVEELSGVSGSRIVTSWKRTTVADGDWLQFNTIRPLNERDVFLAEKIDELSGNSDDRLDEEIKARKNADTFLSGTIYTFSGNYGTFKSKTESNIDYLSGSIDGLKEDLDTEKEDRSREDGLLQAQIDTIKAATDVIMVYGDYHTFTANSGDLILTDADVIKVLVDESTNDKQVYYQWYDPKLEHEWSGWSGIGSLDPYTTYTTGQYINISNDNKISVTGDLINSAQSGQSAYNWITAQSATLSAGFGIQFTSAGQNTMGIKLNAVLNEDDKIVSIGGKELVGGDDYIPYSAVEVKTMGTDKCVGSLTSGSNVLKIAATYAYKDENGDRIDTNYLKISAFGNYVSANPYGISISSDSVVKLVFTPTLPSTLDDNTYYIV